MKLRVDQLRQLKKEMVPYLKGHVEQVVIASILIIVVIGATYSSLLFYRFALSSKTTTTEVATKIIKVRVEEETLQKIDADKKIDQVLQEKLEKARDPFK
ncbi:hypothetical protein KJ903_03160 [Patescibacteria group bacterium]|nr:hypothetical protein [Patescibacteria group bacterium]